MRKLVIAALAVLAIAVPGFARADSGGGAPPGFFDKNYRLDVTFQDWATPVLDATLNDVPSTVPYAAASYLSLKLEWGTFEMDTSHATCFIVGSTTSKVPCSQIGQMVDDASDGGVDAVALAKPVANADGSLRFVAKKITVWVASNGQDTTPPADNGSTNGPATTPAPPKLFTKNIRLNVNLEDVSALVFDASLNDITSKVPQAWSDYLHQELDSATFEVNATKATCFVVKHDIPSTVPCQTIADTLGTLPDGGLDAVVQAQAVAGADGTLSFTAKKITVWV